MSSNWRWLAFAAALLGLTAVALAATGSHVISLSDQAGQRSWSIALQIHYCHAASMLALAALCAAVRHNQKLLLAGGFFVLGTVLFSGSLYLRAAQVDILPGWLTPLGGMVLLLSWLGLALILVKKPART